MRDLFESTAGAVAVEMAAAIAFMTVALLGLTEVGIAYIQQKHAEHAFAVFAELMMSHQGDVTCRDIDDYFDLALEAYNTGIVGARAKPSKFNGSDSSRNNPFRVRLAGLSINRDQNGRLKQTTKWHARKDYGTDFSLGDGTVVSKSLEIEDQFYIVIEGKSILYPAFNFLFGSNATIANSIEPHVVVPRYQTTTLMTGRTTNTCEYK